MVIGDVIERMQQIAPEDLAFEWDNVGLIVGDPEQSVEKILLSLDLTPDVVCEAVRKGFELVITHHPPIFGGLKRLIWSRAQSRMIRDLVKNDISVYTAHTNLDLAPKGVSDQLARLMGLDAWQVLAECDTEGESEGAAGLGRVGRLEVPISAGEFVERVRSRLHPGRLGCALSAPAEKIQTVALCGGSGGELVQDVLELRPDIYLTGELKYHAAQELWMEGIGVVTVGHNPSERIVMPALKRELASRTETEQLTLQISEIETDPFATV